MDKKQNPLMDLANTNIRPVLEPSVKNIAGEPSLVNVNLGVQAGVGTGIVDLAAGDKYAVAGQPKLRLVPTTGVGEGPRLAIVPNDPTPAAPQVVMVAAHVAPQPVVQQTILQMPASQPQQVESPKRLVTVSINDGVAPPPYTTGESNQ